MQSFPGHSLLDASVLLMREGYEFGARHFTKYHSDLLQTRLMPQPAICLRGGDAARLFDDDERFRRAGAHPVRMQRTLVGQGGVQGLVGESHRRFVMKNVHLH